MSQPDRDHTHLAQTMKALAEIEAVSETPSRVETAVMAHWEAAHAPRTRSRTNRFVRGAATAAGVTLVGALAWQRVASGPGAVVETTTPRSSVAAPDPAAAQYTTVAVVGGPLMAGEPIRVVRMRVARSVLGELGVPSARPRDAARVGATSIDTVDIDVLVGEDGVARGVRVPISEL